MRVFLHTFGCKANQYDTETVRQALEHAGASVVDDPAAADAAVVNSCTVTHVAESKMRGLVRRIARERRGRGTARTIVMGCAAAVDDGTIATLPGVAGVVAGSDPHRVLEILGLPVPRLDPILRSFARGGRGWLKIQDGCDEHCTFCATTLARGDNRSRPVPELIEEAAALAARHAEIVLTGVHIGTYGADLAGQASLGRLLERLVKAVPRVRFRLSSVEATEVDDRVADLMVSAPDRLAPHLHAPLQSGSDRVLKRMGRHWYTAARYGERIERLAAHLPVFGLGADVMVGFPGESETDYQATVTVVEALPFTYLHVFPYSERPGTAAPRLGPPVHARVAAERSAELRALAKAKGASHRVARDGQLADIVITGRGHGRFEGVTEDYLSVYFDAGTPMGDRFVGELQVVGTTLTVCHSKPRGDEEAPLRMTFTP
ncbi:MAG: MiaB/RimO family radical SAM methylthiotransferase [Gemmatimonadetes bacterium]|nr:MiaB/RimO family radical SAM methylthiotransferase [Gemmatimonadota bacterium]